MKCLCVKQPWASLIASGRKTLEIRTWRTNYRGALVIVASKSAAKAWLERYPDGPRSAALCVVDLVDVRPVTLGDEAQAGCPVDPEREFAWVLARPREVTPVHVRGRLGLFSAPAEVVTVVDAH